MFGRLVAGLRGLGHVVHAIGDVLPDSHDLLLNESFGIPLACRPPSNLTRAAVHAINRYFGGWWYRDVWVSMADPRYGML
ncbi:MAG TPA: hypothetical protein VKV73_18260 [Chloroflexota bacterium]|nr:hypothetical protein [Chloroflexota bacterium]